MTGWWWIGAVALLVGAVAWRVAWVLRQTLRKRREKAPRNDIYPLW